MYSPAAQSATARRIACGHARENIRNFDRELVRAAMKCRAALAEAMAATGTGGERQCAADHLSDLLQDVFAGERRKLLASLDEEGGDPNAFPWPVADEESVGATVIEFPG